MTPQARNARPVTRPEGDALPGPEGGWAVGFGVIIGARVVTAVGAAVAAVDATVAGWAVAVGVLAGLATVVFVMGAVVTVG